MRYKAIERHHPIDGWKRGPTHIMRDDRHTWCGYLAERRGTRYSEVWRDVPEPPIGALCPTCRAAMNRASRG